MAGLIPDIFSNEDEQYPELSRFFSIDFILPSKHEEDIKLAEYKKHLQKKLGIRNYELNRKIKECLYRYHVDKKSYDAYKRNGFSKGEHLWIRGLAEREKQLRNYGLTEEEIQKGDISDDWVRPSFRNASMKGMKAADTPEPPKPPATPEPPALDPMEMTPGEYASAPNRSPSSMEQVPDEYNAQPPAAPTPPPPVEPPIDEEPDPFVMPQVEEEADTDLAEANAHDAALAAIPFEEADEDLAEEAPAEQPFEVAGEGIEITEQDTAFLQDIKSSPNDDTPRLIWADYLEEEENQPERAEAIRSSIFLENYRNDPNPSADPRTRVESANRLYELLNTHPEWFYPWTWGRENQGGAEFRRGLLHVGSSANRFRQILEQVGVERAMAMVERVKLYGSARDVIEALALNLGSASSPPIWWLPQISSLDLSDNPQLMNWQYGIAFNLTYSGRVPSLRELNLRQTRFGSDDGHAIEQLANSNMLPNLRTLNLSYNNLSPASIDALINARGLQNLQELDLRGNAVSGDWLEALDQRFPNARIATN